VFAPKLAKPLSTPARGLRSAAPPLAARKLVIGDVRDPLEREADRLAQYAMRRQGPAPGFASAPSPSREAGGGEAPAVVDEALKAPGEPLGAATRAFFEPRFGRDFSSVRIHADALAARSAAAVSARAFTVGEQIVFGAGAFGPGHPSGRELIAHELAHTVQQSRAGGAFLQRQPTGSAAPAQHPPPQQAPAHPPPAPRKDYVFIMGADRKGTGNPFYTEAARYFRGHLPNATMVLDKRNLDDLLGWIAGHVKDPIGELYIVAHGNEDGTLAFGLNSASTDGHLTVTQLRSALHPSGGGASALTSVAGVVDAHTRIHIKGCDIGRTQEMIELIDEAFGGAGTVIAPTHEQGYGIDPKLGVKARAEAHEQKMKAFTAALPALPAAPGPVDRKLKGAERTAALKAHDDAEKALRTAKAERKTAIAAEEKRIVPELNQIAELATTEESLSGPMFQRPGTTRFTAAELQPQIDKLYGHLSEKRRKALAAQLVAPDRGSPGDQQGQKIDRVNAYTWKFPEPANVAEATQIYGQNFRDNHFTPRALSSTVDPKDGSVTHEVSGTIHPPGEAEQDYTLTYPPVAAPPTDAKMLAEGKAMTNNPGRYAWRVERTHDRRTGMTTLTAIGERVMCYLHHGSLDVAPHEHFIRPESDPNFYATSTFAPKSKASPPAKPKHTTP